MSFDDSKWSPEDIESWYDSVPSTLTCFRISRSEDLLILGVYKHQKFWGWLGLFLDNLDIELSPYQQTGPFENWHEFSLEKDNFHRIGKDSDVLVSVGDEKCCLIFKDTLPEEEYLFRFIDMVE